MGVTFACLRETTFFGAISLLMYNLSSSGPTEAFLASQPTTGKQSAIHAVRQQKESRTR